ncbi:hypothetical protein HK097_004018 [Rhizophlyctis rosea]|uniref:Uncharacterized protein n=1 Tax=Rhizophlyctis rosea TaxID=64517 RepID=A0AAD5SNE5_9FUNG|nr:hypothetical protein HK097_004018 [Rhizophlyctis rosea]
MSAEPDNLHRNLSHNSFSAFPFATLLSTRRSTPLNLDLSFNDIQGESGTSSTDWSQAATVFSTCNIANNPITETIPSGSRCAVNSDRLQPGDLPPSASPTASASAEPASSGSAGKAGIIAAAVIVPLAVILILGCVIFRLRRRRKGGNTYVASSNNDFSIEAPMAPVSIQRDTGDEWNPTKFHFTIRGLWTSLNAVYVAAHGAAPENSREHIPQSVPSWGGKASGLPYALATDPVNGVPPRIVKSWILYRAVSQVLVAGYFNERLEVSADRLYDLVQAQTREVMGVEAQQDTVTAFVLKCQELKSALNSRVGGAEAYLPAPGEGFSEALHEGEDERGGSAVVGLLPGFIESKTGTVYHKAKVCFIA